jgi:hypothetical protein
MEKKFRKTCATKEELCFIISTIGISRSNTGMQDDDDDDTGLLSIFTRFLGCMFLPEPNFPLIFTNLHK